MRVIGDLTANFPNGCVGDWSEIRKAHPSSAIQSYFLLSLASLAGYLEGACVVLAEMPPVPLP